MAIEGEESLILSLSLFRLPCTDILRVCLTEEFAIEIPDEDADRITTVGEGSLLTFSTFSIPR